MAEFQTFPKPEARVRVKSRQRAEDERAKRDAYRLVDVRDQRRCRACKRRCRSTLACVPDRLEHHHHPFRSLGGRHTTAELISLCALCHSDATRHELIITGHPDNVLTFEKQGVVWHG